MENNDTVKVSDIKYLTAMQQTDMAIVATIKPDMFKWLAQGAALIEAAVHEDGEAYWARPGEAYLLLIEHMANSCCKVHIKNNPGNTGE